VRPAAARALALAAGLGLASVAGPARPAAAGPRDATRRARSAAYTRLMATLDFGKLAVKDPHQAELPPSRVRARRALARGIARTLPIPPPQVDEQLGWTNDRGLPEYRISLYRDLRALVARKLRRGGGREVVVADLGSGKNRALGDLRAALPDGRLRLIGANAFEGNPNQVPLDDFYQIFLPHDLALFERHAGTVDVAVDVWGSLTNSRPKVARPVTGGVNVDTVKTLIHHALLLRPGGTAFILTGIDQFGGLRTARHRIKPLWREVAAFMSAELGVRVRFTPVADYSAMKDQVSTRLLVRVTAPAAPAGVTLEEAWRRAEARWAGTR
jgi:hypothetical protein